MTQNSPTPEPFWFGGQFGCYTDTETGLVLCTFRYYDPATGRWISRDPIGEAGGINLYGYVNDNPVTGVDPLGLWPDGFDEIASEINRNIGGTGKDLIQSAAPVARLGAGVKPREEEALPQFDSFQ